MKGQQDLYQPSPHEIISDNLKAWLDWGFLNKGGFQNITITTSGVYGGDWDRLRPVKDRNFSDGQVWEAARKDWAWQNNTNRTPQPIRVSGIKIDNTFNFFSSHTPNADDTIDAYVDYPNGRVILSSGIGVTPTVRASYTYKTVHIYEDSQADILKEVQIRSHRVDNPNFVSSSGDWSSLGQSRVQLPCIIIEGVGGQRAPYQLGGGHYYRPSFLLHVLAENKIAAERIANILLEQQEKSFRGFSVTKVQNSGAFPLDLNGSVQSGALSFPQLAQDYSFGIITIVETNQEKTNSINTNLHHVPVTIKTETILGENY